MREFFSDNGKINILISVTVIVLAGFGLYIRSIGQKIKAFEKRSPGKP